MTHRAFAFPRRAQLLSWACAALMLWAPWFTAAAQTVYRCGPDGRQYSQAPCPGGQAVDATDTRTEAQRRQAQEAARREQREARLLERERRQREKAAASQRAIGIGAPASAAPASQPGKRQPSQERKRRQDAQGKSGSPAGARPNTEGATRSRIGQIGPAGDGKAAPAAGTKP